MFASPSASCYPEWERQETAETWDFQTFSESDAEGEGEESVPTPRLKQTGSACLGPEQPAPLMNASACANPKGFGGLLAYLPQNPSGSTLPGGSITHGLMLVGYGDGGWEFPPGARDVRNTRLPLAQAQPTPNQPDLRVSPHRAVPSPAGKVSQPQDLL